VRQLIKPYSIGVNSSSNLLEELMRVFCYHVARVARLKKGIITYKTTNGIFTTWKHLEITHQEMWAKWIE